MKKVIYFVIFIIVGFLYGGELGLKIDNLWRETVGRGQSFFIVPLIFMDIIIGNIYLKASKILPQKKVFPYLAYILSGIIISIISMLAHITLTWMLTMNF